MKRLLWPLLTLTALLVINGLLTPGFFALSYKNNHLYGSLIDIGLRSAPLILVSLAMTLVIATGGIDLSVGTVAALAAAAAAAGFGTGFAFPEVLLFALCTGCLVGLLNSILIIFFGVQPIIASLIAMVAGRGVAQLLVGGQIVPLQNSNYLFLGTGSWLSLPFSLWLALFALLILLIFTRWTAAGLFIEAFGSNVQASLLVGLHSRFIQTSVYVLSGLMAALAGLVLSSNIRAVDVNNLGTYLELDAILAVVIGGTVLKGGRFSLVGSVIGALIIQTVTTTINTQGIAVEAMLMVKAAIVILVCLLQSDKIRVWSRRLA